MEDVSQLIDRIRSEFASRKEKIKQQQAEQVEKLHERQRRLEQLEQEFENLRGTWKPRLEAFAKEFGDQVVITPIVSPGQRQASLKFKSPLATVCLRFSAASDADVRNLIVSYDLEIRPILMEFERHSEISFPIGQIDRKRLTDWLDERMIQFVQTYLAVHENPYYLKDQMVEDPVAGIRFPKFTAAATREYRGTIYYFVAEETAAEFEKSHT